MYVWALYMLRGSGGWGFDSVIIPCLLLADLKLKGSDMASLLLGLSTSTQIVRVICNHMIHQIV